MTARIRRAAVTGRVGRDFLPIVTVREVLAGSIDASNAGSDFLIAGPLLEDLACIHSSTDQSPGRFRGRGP
jgi:hypothetical protein